LAADCEVESKLTDSRGDSPDARKGCGPRESVLQEISSASPYKAES
jgi:hypothetical protein